MTENQINVINIISKYQHLLSLEQHFKEDLVCSWVTTLSKTDMAILDAYMDNLSDLKYQLKTNLITC